jgi:hypothetical protein
MVKQLDKWSFWYQVRDLKNGCFKGQRVSKKDGSISGTPRVYGRRCDAVQSVLKDAYRDPAEFEVVENVYLLAETYADTMFLGRDQVKPAK